MCPQDNILSAASTKFCPKVRYFGPGMVKLTLLLVSLSARKCGLVGILCPKVQRSHTAIRDSCFVVLSAIPTAANLLPYH